jgi:hypothetical protein
MVQLASVRHGNGRVELLSSFQSPVLVFAGHFGSGKTEIAVNFALELAAVRRVNLVDLDLVKAYFRCRLARDAVVPRGIRLVAPEGELSQADLPILLPEVAGLIRRREETTVLDVGGDDSGARVLGSLAGGFPPDYELLLVVNQRRPSSEHADATLAMMAEIEEAARLKVTGLVSNTHLMAETTPAIVRDGIAMCREVEARSGRPLRFACAEAPIAAALGDLDLPLLVVRRHILPPFMKRPMKTRLAV